MFGIVGIDPQCVVIAVMIGFANIVQSLAAIQRLAQRDIHHEDSIHILRVGHYPRVIHCALIEFVAPLPGCAFVVGAKNSAFTVARLDRRIDYIRIRRGNRQSDSPHVDAGQS